jgi:hypothetical protein
VTLPLALHDAAKDVALKGAPRDVLLWLWGTIEQHDYRPVTISKIGDALGIRRDTAIAALNLLVSRGYLAEGRRVERGIRTFRLLATRLERAS